VPRLVLSLSLLASSVAVAGVALASTAPQQLVLRLSDLPAGFSVDRKETGPRSNAVVARETTSTLAQLTAWGRIGGYQATFTREPTLRGLLAGSLQVQSIASVYRTTRGSAASFVHTRTACRKAPFKQLSIGGRLGHEAAYCSAQRQSAGQKIAVYVFVWRRDSISAAVLLAGLAGVVDPTEAVALGRKQDARMVAALR